MKVVFCIPTVRKPHQATLDSLRASVPLFDDAGIEHAMVSEIGNPYISNARNVMLRKALDAKADAVVFLDHDVSWKPQDLLTLVQAKGDVVGGTYRFKREPEEYMGTLLADDQGFPIVREDGCLKMFNLPAGFLKVTREAVNKFVEAYPDLLYGERVSPHIDLFNHGAYKFTWWGEDYAFCRRWLECGGEIWCPPNLDITHHGDKEYPGNFHEWLRRQPGGDLA